MFLLGSLEFDVTFGLDHDGYGRKMIFFGSVE